MLNRVVNMFQSMREYKCGNPISSTCKKRIKIMVTLIIKKGKVNTNNINYEHGHHVLTVFGE